MKNDTEFGTVVTEISNITTERDISAYNNFWTRQIRNNKFVMKKLNRSTMKKEILEFLDKKMLKMCTSRIKRFNKYMEIINKNTDTYNEIVIYAWKKIMKLIIPLEALEADAYLLGRVFKKFDISKRQNDEPIKPHNIIIYAGDGHSIIYRKFLKSIGFNRIESTKTGFNNCIDMIGITQPLFSDWPATTFDMDDGEDMGEDEDIGYKSDEDMDEDDEDDEDMEEDDEDLEDDEEDEEEDEDLEDEDLESYIDYEGEDDSKVNPEILFPKNIFGQYGNFSNETTNEKQDIEKNRPNPYANSKERRKNNKRK